MGRFQTLLRHARIDAMSLLGLVVIALVLAVIFGSYVGVLRSLFGPSTSVVRADFKDTATLRKGDAVRVKGVNVGTVKDIVKAKSGRATTVEMKVEDKIGKVYGDARASVAWKSLLGGAFVVNLAPGTPAGGELSDGSIPVAQTTTQVELDDITTVISGGARAGLRTLPPELSETFKDPRTLGDLARTVDSEAPSLARGLNAVRGQRKDRDLRALITETNKVTRALDAPDDELRTLVSATGGTLQTTAAREADLRTTIAGAPRTLEEVDVTMRDLDGTLGIARPLLGKLREPAADVGPTLSGLRPTVMRAAALLDDARPLVRDLRPSVTALARASVDGIGLLDDLDPSLERLDKTILPYTNEDDPSSKRTMAEMVGPGLGGLANVAAPFDANGHILRFPFASGSSPLYLPCQTFINNPDKKAMVECRELSQLIKDYLEYNPLRQEPQGSPPGKQDRP